jgi:hypothetical protein
MHHTRRNSKKTIKKKPHVANVISENLHYNPPNIVYTKNPIWALTLTFYAPDAQCFVSSSPVVVDVVVTSS